MNQDMNNIKLKSTVKIIFLAGISLLVILNFSETVYILKNIYGIIFPLLLGAVFAYILNILASEYERIYFPRSSSRIIKRSRKGVCILLSIVTIALVLAFFMLILIPKINQFITLLLAGIPALYDKVVAWSIQHADELPALKQKLEELNINSQNISSKGMEILSIWAEGTVSVVGTIFSTIMNIILALIFSIYILLDKEDLQNKFDRLFRTYMKPDRRKKLYYIVRTANESFTNFIVGQCKEAVILGLLCTIGMMIFRFPYAVIIGPVIGLTALIPMLGAYIGAVVGFLLIVIINPVQAVLFLLFIIILQQIEGNLIYPKVVGESIGLPGIWVFAAITVGGGFMGIPGVLLGVPVFATFYKLLSKSVNDRLN